MVKIILEAGTYKYEFHFSKSNPPCKILNKECSITIKKYLRDII